MIGLSNERLLFSAIITLYLAKLFVLALQFMEG
jgi:hypothetical protein